MLLPTSTALVIAASIEAYATIANASGVIENLFTPH